MMIRGSIDNRIYFLLESYDYGLVKYFIIKSQAYSSVFIINIKFLIKFQFGIKK